MIQTSPQKSLQYRPLLDLSSTERAIEFVKTDFAHKLAQCLQLQKVSAPMLVQHGTGINDDLNGTERPVTVNASGIESGKKLEIVHSLAKWKRLRLQQLGIQHGQGLYTDMRALRPDEILSNIHSICVHQWDWEKHISRKERTLDFLKQTVLEIY